MTWSISATGRNDGQALDLFERALSGAHEPAQVATAHALVAAAAPLAGMFPRLREISIHTHGYLLPNGGGMVSVRVWIIPGIDDAQQSEEVAP